ncbi:MAG: SDR family NAD(P)-dependent oxidoreductase [Elusimicrobia bacterium]|nr:SDR family NAD(P)-dependent oxidoreductase [Elusimicrobiota bacterium]
MDRRTALVTGAGRGIGLEVCRQLGAQGLRVILTARDAGAGEAAAQDLRRGGLDASFHFMDVSSEAGVAAAARRLEGRGAAVDVLVNNAGVYPASGVLDGAAHAFKEALATNFFGALWSCRAFVPGMLERGFGRVVNVTSGGGSFGEGLDGPAAYCISKAALNALTVKLAREARGDVKVNAACPGWTRTRLGGPAGQSVERGADTIVWLALAGCDGPNGGCFRDRRPVPW